MRINKHDTQGTKPLLGKGELGYDDYAAGGDTGRVYVGTGTENIALAERLESNMMTKAQFNALAEERKAQRAGSGWDEWGYKHNALPNVNEGLWTANILAPNYIGMGYNIVGSSLSKTPYPLLNINGVRHRVSGGDATYPMQTVISLPTAPTIYPHDTVLTTEQINSGVIKHADASNSGLIVNGKFDTDTSGWAAQDSNIVVQSGKLKILTTNTAGGALQTIPTIIGKKYIIEGISENVTSTDSRIRIVPTDSFTTIADSNINTSNAPSVLRVEFTATTTSVRVYLRANGSSKEATFDNIAVYPADAISRSDLVFLESWHEDISEKNFVYPLGNVQYLGGNTDGLTGIANGAFTGFEQYSLFGNWQAPSALIGKGYVWSSLTEAQKRAFIANPENNCYLDGDKTIQVRYRVRVLMGEDSNSMARATVQGKAVVPSTVIFTAPNTTVDAGLYSNTSTTYTYTGTSTNAISIANISRRNQGIYHNVYNPNGTKKASDNAFWYNTAVSFTSISDCFDASKLLAASGYIGSVSGRPDGLFYDQVHESDITDLRNSSKKVEDYNRLISREFNKLVAGTTRGKEVEWETRISFGGGSYIVYDYDDGRVRFNSYDSKMNLQIGDVIQITYYNGTTFVSDRCYISLLYSDATFGFGGLCPNISQAIGSGAMAPNGIRFFMYSNKSTRTKSNTLLHCDIIGKIS